MEERTSRKKKAQKEDEYAEGGGVGEDEGEEEWGKARKRMSEGG